MGRNKTTGDLTRPYSFRLNPSYPQDKEAIDIIEGLLEKNFSMRQIMTDAILRASGHTPEMFAEVTAPNSILGNMERLLSSFASEIMGNLDKRGVATKTAFDDYEEEEPGKWANTLARGFLARQQRAVGNDDE